MSLLVGAGRREERLGEGAAASKPTTQASRDCRRPRQHATTQHSTRTHWTQAAAPNRRRSTATHTQFHCMHDGPVIGHGTHVASTGQEGVRGIALNHSPSPYSKCCCGCCDRGSHRLVLTSSCTAAQNCSRDATDSARGPKRAATAATSSGGRWKWELTSVSPARNAVHTTTPTGASVNDAPARPLRLCHNCSNGGDGARGVDRAVAGLRQCPRHARLRSHARPTRWWFEFETGTSPPGYHAAAGTNTGTQPTLIPHP